MGLPKSAYLRLLITDRTVTKLVGILCVVLVKLSSFICPTDFAILDCEIDFDISVILGMPFLATFKVLVYMEIEQMKFTLNEDHVLFNICQLMKHPKYMREILVIDMINADVLAVLIEERLGWRHLWLRSAILILMVFRSMMT